MSDVYDYYQIWKKDLSTGPLLAIIGVFWKGG